MQDDLSAHLETGGTAVTVAAQVKRGCRKVTPTSWLNTGLWTLMECVFWIFGRCIFSTGMRGYFGAMYL